MLTPTQRLLFALGVCWTFAEGAIAEKKLHGPEGKDDCSSSIQDSHDDVAFVQLKHKLGISPPEFFRPPPPTTLVAKPPHPHREEEDETKLLEVGVTKSRQPMLIPPAATPAYSYPYTATAPASAFQANAFSPVTAPIAAAPPVVETVPVAPRWQMLGLDMPRSYPAAATAAMTPVAAAATVPVPDAPLVPAMAAPPAPPVVLAPTASAVVAPAAPPVVVAPPATTVVTDAAPKALAVKSEHTHTSSSRDLLFPMPDWSKKKYADLVHFLHVASLVNGVTAPLACVVAGGITVYSGFTWMFQYAGDQIAHWITDQQGLEVTQSGFPGIPKVLHSDE